jgi:hypothetical protein
MAAAVLADEVAQVRPEAHIHDGGFVEPPLVDGEALEEDETSAVEEVVTEGLQVGA